MNRNLSIKLKALFLLVVFASNTAVGFACAVGVDMGFNSPHHSETEEPAEAHMHDDGKKHVHEKETSVATAIVHADGSNHQHDSEPATLIPVDGNNLLKKEDGGCCTNEVQEFQDLDKNVSVNTTGIYIPVFVAILNTYFNIDFSAVVKDFPVHYKVRFYYPPPTDIRIAMQRFQI
ncbi:MAG: hypothetical protein HEQ40_02370 [Lacibacter sp.]|jgi:hypothetical protein